jgi:3-oxoacyl-[acyl-carrier-protein] synthase-3
VKHSPPIARIKIVGTGLYAPERVVTAHELAPSLGRSAEWILSRTGVARRHYADGEAQEDMGAAAARQALGDTPPDLVLSASGSAVQALPDTATFIAGALGLEGVPAFSVHASCLSFVVGLQVAAGLLQTGPWRRVLLVSAEKGSPSLDPGSPESAALIGDGAAAAVLEPTPEGEASALLAFQMTTFPSGASFTEVAGGGTRHHPFDPSTTDAHQRFFMDGPKVYRMGRQRVAELLDGLWARLGHGPEAIDVIVPHQASGPALEALRRFYGLGADRVVDVISEYGNCIAASVPMALHVAAAEGRIRRGDRVLLIGTGAGLSVAGAVLIW